MEAYTREVAQSSAAEIEEMESRRGSTKISWKSSARAIRMVASRKVSNFLW